MRALVVVVLLVSILVAAGVGAAGALDPNWPEGISDHAQAIPENQEVTQIAYPAVGQALPGSASTAADDFCGGDPRDYTVERCKPKWIHRHSGNDVFPTHGDVPGDLRAVAARAGQVVRAGCGSGPGFFVTVDGNDGIHYRYFHLASIPANIVNGVTVKAGEQIGEVGKTDGCFTNGGYPTHLHFDRFDDDLCDTNCARDPYPSLRNAYANPGQKADGSYDAAILTRWANAVAGLSKKDAYAIVGWPTRGSFLGSANVVTTTSSTGAGGLRQWLGSGRNTFDPSYRSGAMARRASSSTAFWVVGNFFKRWRVADPNGSFEDGYLGWPITDAFPSGSAMFQLFDGGCIYTYDGSTFHDKPWGTAPCVL